MRVLFARGEKGRIKMKKKVETAGIVRCLFMTLVSLVFLRAAPVQAGMTDIAQTGGESVLPPGSLTKVIALSDGEIRQVPRYIAEVGAVYELNEATITVEVTGRGSSEGADVATFSKKVEELPDNDLERIEKQMVFEGISCELLSVVYDVTREDENGIPLSYTASCEYGGLKKYSNSYPNAWQMTVQYDLCAAPVAEESVTEWESYEYRVVPSKKIEGEPGGRAFEAPETEEADIEPETRRFRIGPAPGNGEEEAEKSGLRDIALPLAAGTGVTIPFIIWIAVLTAPIFSLKEGERYCYIGQIRLKKADGVYTAYLTKRLLARAELPVFRIKLPRRMWKKGKCGVFYVHCPDGKRIAVIAGKTAHFTVEGD